MDMEILLVVFTILVYLLAGLVLLRLYRQNGWACDRFERLALLTAIICVICMMILEIIRLLLLII